VVWRRRCRKFDYAGLKPGGYLFQMTLGFASGRVTVRKVGVDLGESAV